MLREQYLSFVPDTASENTGRCYGLFIKIFVENAVMLSNGILSIRSYKSTWVAFLQSAVLWLICRFISRFGEVKRMRLFTMDEQDRARRNFIYVMSGKFIKAIGVVTDHELPELTARG